MVDVRFGLEAEWKDFERRHPRFLARSPELHRIMDAVVSRKFESDNVADKVIFYLGRLAVEDFEEILLNAGNGYGVAGLKLLRPMFELVITMMHLIRQPAEVVTFLEYHGVHMRKIVNHITNAGDDPTKYFTKEELAEIEEKFNALGGKFKDMMSWTNIDLATMARNVGFGESYIALGYFPTLQIHITVTAIMTRLEAADGGTAFKPGAQRMEADAALWGAHLCLAVTLEEHIRCFGLPIDHERVRAIYHDCWPGEVREPNPLRHEGAES